MFEVQRNRVIDSLDAAHDSFYRADKFGGPSLHFHLRSLECAHAMDFERFAECVYAVLPSWGMHRMGGGPKMRDFAEFRSSLQEVWPEALRLRGKTFDAFDEDDWLDLKLIFYGIQVMATGTLLVGNSKVMAHLLPHLVPPVDREYTLTFLYGHGQLINDVDREWRKFRELLEGFFYPVLRYPDFQSKSHEWLARRHEFKWDTSPLKILDNLIIGLVSTMGSERPGMN